MGHFHPHKPVMLQEVIGQLDLDKKQGLIIDSTFGAGGYSREILSTNKNIKLVAFDRDSTVKVFADMVATDFPDRFKWLNLPFTELKNLRTHLDGLFEDLPIIGIVFDLGVSSMQLDQAQRGFSFQQDGPLDMRMSNEGITASDLVNTIKEKELADIIFKYGEERMARKIAAAIVGARKHQPFSTTKQLAKIIYEVKPLMKGKIDPATKTFQAIRIAINKELDQLEQGIEAAWEILSPQGRLVTVSFHGLEDAIIKSFFQSRARPKVKINKYRPREEEKTSYTASMAQDLLVVTKKPLSPTLDEIKSNPRSRSAKLRSATKLQVN